MVLTVPQVCEKIRKVQEGLSLGQVRFSLSVNGSIDRRGRDLKRQILEADTPSEQEYGKSRGPKGSGHSGGYQTAAARAKGPEEWGILHRTFR